MIDVSPTICNGEGLDMAIARRIGLEQEFFLVDNVGRLSHAADEFLAQCQVTAPQWGCNPGEFVPEFVKSMVEINTPPAYTVAELAQSYLKNLQLAIHIAHEMGLRLYPLGSYPLAIAPVMREKINYHAQARTLGYNRAAHAGRCAGTHLHLEAPPGSIDSRIGVAYNITFQERLELLNLYNLATALDVALIALSRTCPFYEGRLSKIASHVVRYRGNDTFGWEGVFTKVPIAGGLRPYADSIETLVELQFARHYGWLEEMDRAGVARSLFLNTGGDLLESAWNPIRLNALGTVEIRSLDSTYPDLVIAFMTLVECLATRLREESWTVKPSAPTFCFDLQGNQLLVPEFEFLNSILLYAAVTTGISHPFVREYVESIFKLALEGNEANSALLLLKENIENARTVESELLKEYATDHPLSESVGLHLVRQCCDRLEEQVLSLSKTYSLTVPGAVGV
jgi:carboxylate-amine ligase